MYNKLITKFTESFDNFRRWFNANFKLVINNRYAGLLRIDSSCFRMFIVRLAYCLERDERDEKSYYVRSKRNYFKFKLGHDTIKVYPF